MKHVSALLLLASTLSLAAFALVGCGGGSSEGSGTPNNPSVPINPVTTTTTINLVDLGGTAVATGLKTPINAAVNEGLFTIDWDVTSTNPYHYSVYVSDDTQFDRSTDLKFYTNSCGDDQIVYNCNDTGHEDCHFDSSNLISCGVVSPGNFGIDLTSFLTGIPQIAYLFFEACTNPLDDCKTQSFQIELQ